MPLCVLGHICLYCHPDARIDACHSSFIQCSIFSPPTFFFFLFLTLPEFLASSLVSLSPVRSVCLQKSQDRDMQQRGLVQKMGVF